MPLSMLAGCLVCLLMAVASQASAFAQSLVVGGKSFTEQQLVAEITSQFLTAKGFRTRVRIGFSTSGIRKELEAGLVDVYWEYTGTALVTFNNVREKLGPTGLCPGQGAGRPEGADLVDAVQDQQYLCARDAAGRCSCKRDHLDFRAGRPDPPG